MEALKKCPMCASDANNGDIQGVYAKDGTNYYCWIECLGCGTKGPKTDSLEEAIRKWNRRDITK